MHTLTYFSRFPWKRGGLITTPLYADRDSWDMSVPSFVSVRMEKTSLVVSLFLALKGVLHDKIHILPSYPIMLHFRYVGELLSDARVESHELLYHS